MMKTNFLCRWRSGLCLGVMVLILTGIFQPVFAQEKPASRISGTVTDETNEPLPGVSVLQKGSRNGTVSDTNGKFSLSVPNGSTVTFSFIGYLTQDIIAGTQKSLNLKMVPQANQLQEVVAIGYQTLRKSDVTGAVSSLKAKDLNLSVPTVGQAIVGKVAGVQVAQVSGAPYVSTKIRVRGVASVNASSDPLYVIDGYPAANDVFINPNDIESIDILKDAASAAIYGSRAAGGVVLITTKKGREGQSHFEYEVQTGVNQLSKKIDLLNADQFINLMIDARNSSYRDLMVNAGKAFTDANYSDNNATRIANIGNAGSVSIPTDFYNFATQQAIASPYNTDWQDELYGNPIVQRHNLSINGGSKNARYYVSGGYLNQGGIITSTGQRRLNLRANVDADISDKIKAGANIAITQNNNREVQEGRFNQGPILGALIYMPVFPAYNDDGTLAKNAASSQSSSFGYQTIENPVALARETKINRKGLRGTYNAYASYSFLPELIFKANLGMQTYNEKYDFYNPTSLSSGANPPGSPQAQAAAYSIAQNASQLDQLGEFTLNFKKSYGKSRLDAIGGYTIQKTMLDVVSVTARGYTNDQIEEITSKGADPTNFSLNSGLNGLTGTGKAEYSLLSYLGRVAYTYDDKYFLTGSFRRDGSSRFGPLNKYGTFPSVSAGWTLSNESFYNDWLGKQSTLKLRASWGLSGNNNIGNYNFQQVVSAPGGAVFGSGNIATAVWPGNLRDQGLGWESTSQYNFGLDAGLFNGRLSVIANYYISRSYDLLFNQPVSAVAGTTSILTNLRDSKVQNKGFDLQLDGRVLVSKDFNLNLSGNISFNRNKVLDLGGASTIFTSGAERSYITHITMAGQPIGMFYGFKVLGIATEENYKTVAPSSASSNPLRPGDLYFEDVNKDGVVNDLDKSVIGNPYPDFTYGLALSMNYKAFDFNAAFNGTQGNDVLDGQDYYLFNMEGSGNQYAVVDQRFRSTANPGNGQIYRASRGGTQSNSTRLSTFYIQDGSYFRCTNITLGYKFPALKTLGKAGISGIRVYASVDNAFTISNYKGYNPEVDYNNGANLAPGVDYGKYPLVRAINLGARITF